MIPVVSRYGEEGGSGRLDSIHCERLSLRSRAHQFKIRPHRHQGISQLFLLSRGSGVANLDGEGTEIVAPALMIVSELSVHDFLWSGDVEGYVLSVEVSLIETLLNSGLKVMEPLLSTQILTVGGELQRMSERLRGLYYEYSSGEELRWRNQAVEAWLVLLMTEVVRSLQQGEAKEGGGPGMRHLKEFRQLINEHYLRHYSVARYAELLGITAPHLNALCQQWYERNALALIHERVVLEAERQLVYTVMTVSEIADQLGFVDPAYFSRFFKRHKGMSPKAFRDRLRTADQPN